MGYYRNDFENNQIAHWIEVKKADNFYDYGLIKQYKRFVHFDENKKPKAFLCIANSPEEALGIAADYLNKIAIKV